MDLGGEILPGSDGDSGCDPTQDIDCETSYQLSSAGIVFDFCECQNI